MNTILQLQAENKALALALQLTVTALRLAPTYPLDGEAWPECPSAAMNRVRLAMVPLMGYHPLIMASVEAMSPMNDSPEDQDQLLLRWNNLKMAISLIATPAPV